MEIIRNEELPSMKGPEDWFTGNAFISIKVF